MEIPKKEVLTVGDRRVTFERPQPPNTATLESGIEPLAKASVYAEDLLPDNLDRADGAPLRLLFNEHARLDLSKRRKADMGFWHRSADFSEIIFCVSGALTWETEIGTVTLHPGEFIVIPRGVAHRSRLAPESTDENVLLEIKIDGDLEPTEIMAQVFDAGR